jgi:hypothetical protein
MPKADIPSKPKTKKASKSTVPTSEEIAVRAYLIYLGRNGSPGDPRADWLRAEQELLAETLTKRPRVRKKSNVTSIAA